MSSVVSTHHAGLDSFNPACLKPQAADLGPIYLVNRNYLVEPLGSDRFNGRDVKYTPHMAVGVVRDQQPVGERFVFNSLRQVDRAAHDGIFSLGDASHGHQPRIDPHPHLEILDAPFRLQRLLYFPGCIDNRQASTDSLLGIILVGLRGAKDSLEAIPGEAGYVPVMLRN